MNYALIFAGGCGSRMKSDVPKQFICVQNKPIIVHTINHFQNHEMIDGIVVVCIDSYIEHMHKFINEYNLTKVMKVVPGGSTGQESIFKGLQACEGIISDEDVILIHDGVRPLINAELITKNIDCVNLYGNSISVSKATETVCLIDDSVIGNVLDRSKCYIGRAPQSFRYRDIYGCHKRAQNEGYDSAVDSASLLRHYGYTLHYVQCSHLNLKITTQVDLMLFKAWVEDTTNKNTTHN